MERKYKSDFQVKLAHHFAYAPVEALHGQTVIWEMCYDGIFLGSMGERNRRVLENALSEEVECLWDRVHFWPSFVLVHFQRYMTAASLPLVTLLG
ncbi:hypothetical protein PRUPE_8G029100 [Prunus persica]|uniref:Uncharacterized protein n=1 Tax=Prunus persica TaxID=3760 RepID=A0A251MS04_PRUPE|nr:hypothetical protein PRUPE_8G029100 [Prunus persica]